jgi:hypothetical protein
MASRGSGKGRRKKDRMPKRLFKHEPPPAAALPPGLPSNIQVIQGPVGQEKMSDVLKDFIKPYQEAAPTEDAMRRLLMLGILAWNAAILPEDKGRELIDEMLDPALAGASREDRGQSKKFVEALVWRKLELFAENRRMILSFELTNLGHEYHLSVMSTLDIPPHR